ncbi:hypothetical protein ScalyP_jg1809 [Parmales sp. scaly parma]|nr:hypothetical protein ScalyP_jg1809 [Parmales sp. scaly parma]
MSAFPPQKDEDQPNIFNEKQIQDLHQSINVQCDALLSHYATLLNSGMVLENDRADENENAHKKASVKRPTFEEPSSNAFLQSGLASLNIRLGAENITLSSLNVLKLAREIKFQCVVKTEENSSFKTPSIN